MRSLETLIQDIRYGWGTILRTPGVSAVAVLSPALGIGANAGIFALVDRVMLRVLPVKDSQQLVVFDDVLPHPEFKDCRNLYPVFDGVAGTARLRAVSTGDSDDASNVLNGALVSGNYFDVLGVRPLLGHALTPADDTDPGAHPVVVISYAAWRGRFHGDSSVIGHAAWRGCFNGVPPVTAKPTGGGPGQFGGGWGGGGLEDALPVSPATRD